MICWAAFSFSRFNTPRILMNKKLIEVAIPLQAINEASGREKSIRHGHPSTLHLWWSRKPLATTRAVLWASLVDDPSAHPDRFPTEADQARERSRLFKICEELVKWENSNDPHVLEAARREIENSMGSEPIEFLDPFAGGGSIPLEAQRLGLVAHAHDLNPVAVLINKAMIEIPPRFAGKPSVHPCTKTEKTKQNAQLPLKQLNKRLGGGCSGLADDIRYYGEWMKREANQKIGKFYPKVRITQKIGDTAIEKDANVIAWIWARTVTCPNPACRCKMPLANNFVLSKKNQTIWVKPELNKADKKFVYTIQTNGEPSKCPKIGKSKFQCIECGTSVGVDYIKTEAKAGRMGADLIAIVAESEKGRAYIEPSREQLDVFNEIPIQSISLGKLSYNPKDLWTCEYSLDTFESLFSPRQLLALTTFSDLIGEVVDRVRQDARAAGMHDDEKPLAEGGDGALAYAQAIATYLAFAVDKMADCNSTIASWSNSRDSLRNTFGRQAIPMNWDYAESNPFSESTGCFMNCVEWIYKFMTAHQAVTQSQARQFDAQSDCGLRQVVVSSDPPYYDNIGYADLSDYFYVWLRRSLKDVYPKIFRTVQVPKDEELIASPYRHQNDKDRAKDFFESGMSAACRQIYAYARDDVPVTIYYAFKQRDAASSDGDSSIPRATSSSGWETMLSSIVNAGFQITGTWPIRTERGGRTNANDANALSSSIVLVCRKRPATAPTATRREFLRDLDKHLSQAIKALQESHLDPVDMAQSSIGPGMAIYSRYAKIVDQQNRPVTVRAALQLINARLDAYLNDGSSYDKATQCCVEIYKQHAFDPVVYGDIDVLTRAKNTSVDALAELGVAHSARGQVALVKREDIYAAYKANNALTIEQKSCAWIGCQLLAQALAQDGIVDAARIYRMFSLDDAATIHELAYQLYHNADLKNWAKEAHVFNVVVAEWEQIQQSASTPGGTDMGRKLIE